MKICLAGPGAFGTKHLEALSKIEGVDVVSLVGVEANTEAVAKKWRIPHWTGDLAEGLRQPGVEAVILATPTQIHARQAEQCMLAGKHVLVEIPMADTLADAERLRDEEQRVQRRVARLAARERLVLLDVLHLGA